MGVIHKQKAKHKVFNKTFLLTVGVLLPIVVGSSVFVMALSYCWALNDHFADEVPLEMADFMESDPQHLAVYANKFERVDALYNHPFNLTGDGWDYYPITDTTFKLSPAVNGIYNQSMFLERVDPFNASDPFNEVVNLNPSGHAAVYSGFTASAEGARYAVASREQNSTELAAAKKVCLEIVKAYDLLSAVTPDGSMTRFAVPDTPKARAMVDPGHFIENHVGSHLIFPVNYTGPNDKQYTFWCETGTSVDCYLGVYIGLGMIYALCNDTEVRSIIRTTVDRMLTYHVKTGWRFIDHDGKTHSMGAEAMTGAPITDTAYALTFLRIGKTVHPEKWASLYDRYTHDRLSIYRVGKHAQWGITAIFAWAGGYFNINLAMSIAGVLTFLEDDPAIKTYYQRHLLCEIYDMVKYHRNTWFDTMYYLGMVDSIFTNYQQTILEPSRSKMDSENADFIDANIGDSLMRMSLRKFPFRRFPTANSNASYSTTPYTSPIPGAPYPDVQIYDWEKDINLNNPMHKLLAQSFNPGSVWDRAIPSDWIGTSTWLWEGSPFSRGTMGGDGASAAPSGSYLAPYWLSRYMGLNCVTMA